MEASWFPQEGSLSPRTQHLLHPQATPPNLAESPHQVLVILEGVMQSGHPAAVPLHQNVPLLPETGSLQQFWGVGQGGMVGSGPRKPSSPAQGMEEESVSLGAQNEVACVSRGLRSMALGLSVIIRKMGTMLASKKGLSWGSNGGGMLSSTACPFPGMPCTPHWQHPRPHPLPVGRMPKSHQSPN